MSRAITFELTSYAFSICRSAHGSGVEPMRGRSMQDEVKFEHAIVTGTQKSQKPSVLDSQSLEKYSSKWNPISDNKSKNIM